MADFVVPLSEHAFDAPIPNLLALVGVVFCTLAVVGQVPKLPRIEKQWRYVSAVTGVVVLAFAIFFHIEIVQAKELASDLTKRLDAMMADSTQRGLAELWLKSNHDFYHVDDAAIVAAYERLIPGSDSLEAESVATYARRVQTEIREDHPALFELRRRAELGESPFQRLGLPVRIGLPGVRSEQPPSCKAYLPTNSDFRNRRIELVNPQTGRRLILFGRGAIVGPTSVDIQLNGGQVEHLFRGSLPESSAEALAVLHLGDGPLMDPSAAGDCPDSSTM